MPKITGVDSMVEQRNYLPDSAEPDVFGRRKVLEALAGTGGAFAIGGA
jgi:hypothetical protein